LVFAPVEDEPDPLGVDELLGVDDEDEPLGEVAEEDDPLGDDDEEDPLGDDEDDAPDDDEPLGEAEGLLDDEVLLICTPSFDAVSLSRRPEAFRPSFCW